MGALTRRSALAAIFSSAALLLTMTAAPAGSSWFPFFHKSSQNWTQFRYGRDNNAVVAGRLQTSWRVETGGQISASPTLVDGILYVGNNAGTFYAIDAGSGKTLWQFTVSNPLMSAPLVYGDLVILGEGDAQSMGNSPSEPVKVGDGESSLIALDRHTGTLRWKKTMTGSAMPTPALIDGILVHHNGAGWVSGYDPMTGRMRFAHHLESVASMSAILPLPGNDFATTGVGTNAVWRMSSRDGSVVWRSVFPSGASGLGDCPPVSDGTRIMCDYVMPVAPDWSTVVGHSAVQHAFAVDEKTGKRLWDVALESGPLPPRNEAAIPLLAGNVLCIGSAVAPAMHGYDPETGKRLWTVATHGPVKGGAVFVDGIVYFGDLGGYLWAVDPHAGTVVGKEYARTKFNVGSPIVDGKTLIIGSDSGTILALPLADIRLHQDGDVASPAPSPIPTATPPPTPSPTMTPLPTPSPSPSPAPSASASPHR